jgi:uncharacterized protein YhaN
MKIRRMHLMAYGPFSDLALDFAGRRRSFHLVYGPNEAGKSSALRALRNMLFGIPARTPDSFRHPHPKLRIGAELIRADGETIAFVRRKGLRKTLRAADDRSPLADDALASFLGGVDRDLFEQMFAIGHSDLVQGGEEIIAGGGRVGQALFAAGAGLVHLQRLQQHLDATLDELFKPGGSKPRINRAISLLKDVRKHQKDALLLAKTWESHHSALQEAQTRQETSRRHLYEHKQALAALARIHEALPLIARRKELLAALPALEGAPDLEDDFEDRRRETENAVAWAAKDFERTDKSIADLREKMSTLSVPVALLEQAPMVEALQQDFGSFRKARQDRPTLEARMRSLRDQAVRRLSQLGLPKIAGRESRLPFSPAVLSEVQAMSQAYERLQTRRDAMRQRRREVESEIATLEDERKSLPLQRERGPLKTILQSAQDAGPLEKQLAEARSALRQQEKALRNRLKRQTLWTGELEALDVLPLPSRESTRRLEEQLNAAGLKIERLQEDRIRKTEELEDLRNDLRLLEIDHEVPTENQLTVARELRDTGWRLVRRQLEGQTPAEEDLQAFTEQLIKNGSLVDAFEAGMHRSDQIADLLRREAEQVSRKALLETRRLQTGEKLRTIDQTLDEARGVQAMLVRQWEALWAPSDIHPLSPAEMQAWLADITAVRDKTGELQAGQAKCEALASQIRHWKSQLADALTLADDSASRTLSELIDAARHAVVSREERRFQIERIDQALRKLARELKSVVAEKGDLERDLQCWKAAWVQQVTALGLRAEASPAAALAMIESIRETQGYLDEADVLDKRILGIDRDAAAFQERVHDLVHRLAPELTQASAEEASILLNAKLNQGRSQQSRQKALQRQLEDAQAEREQAAKRLADANALMQALCREAGCADAASLPEIEKRARQRKTLMRESQDIANGLRRLSAGATVEAFISEAENVDPDTLVPEMERLKETIASLEQDRSDLDQTIGTARAELKRMDGRADAAAHAEEAEHLLARLESQVEQYARTKIAAVLLARTIEQYREKHQGPLIERASVFFNRMTVNAFRGMRAEYDEKGHPVLVGIRSAGGEPVGVSGMSDGTADQLYLALRLASLEHYLSSSEPLPFVVDDILLRFDDDRALATLEVLLDLSTRTQIIFFTHHQHLVTLAQSAFDDSQIDVMSLGSGS